MGAASACSLESGPSLQMHCCSLPEQEKYVTVERFDGVDLDVDKLGSVEIDMEELDMGGLNIDHFDLTSFEASRLLQKSSEPVDDEPQVWLYDCVSQERHISGLLQVGADLKGGYNRRGPPSEVWKYTPPLKRKVEPWSPPSKRSDSWHLDDLPSYNCSHVHKFLKQRGFSNVLAKRRGVTNSTYPLHVAVRENNSEMVQQLLAARADPWQKNGEGLTPTDLGSKLNTELGFVSKIFDNVLAVLPKPEENPELKRKVPRQENPANFMFARSGRRSFESLEAIGGEATRRESTKKQSHTTKNAKTALGR